MEFCGVALPRPSLTAYLVLGAAGLVGDGSEERSENLNTKSIGESWVG